MSSKKGTADYSPFAWFYNRYLNGQYQTSALSVLDRILLPHVPDRANILDLCCGTGHLTQMLAERGYGLTGVDLSKDMLRFARENVPTAGFLCADARDFHLPAKFDAAISTFDSLNHILVSTELERVFRHVHAVLVDGGYWVFDLNTREAYETQWSKSGAFIADDHAFFVRGGFDPKKRLGHTEITMFRGKKSWRCHDTLFYQRCHSLAQVRKLLQRAGFRSIRYFHAQKDLDMPGPLGVGRVFFRARKSETV